MSDSDELGNRLELAAASLNRAQRVPIDLARVLQETGLGVELRSEGGGGLDGALRRATRGNDVVVYGCRPGEKLRPRQRFTIAHEVGHHLLAGWGVPAPVDNRDYWERENLCNLFAAALLIPDTAVRYAILPPPTTPGELYSRLRLIAERAWVSREVVCKRVGPRLPGFAAWEIDRLARHDVLGRVRWTVEDHRALGQQARSHVALGHPLAKIIMAGFANAPHSVAELSDGLDPWIVEHRTGSLWAVQFRSGQRRIPSEGGPFLRAAATELQAACP